MFQAYNLENRKFMEYTEDLGAYEEVPVEAILTAWEKVYGRDRVHRWIRIFEERGANSLCDFWKEDVTEG